MPTSLADLRARLQTVLDDAAADFWTTAELDEHVQRAIRDFSHYLPLEKKSTLATSSGNRQLALTTLNPRIRIVAVEYNNGNWPPTFVPFSMWADTLTFLDQEPDGADADIYWYAPHTINGTDTLPEDQDETVMFAAAAFACDQQQADATNQVNTGGKGTTRDWAGLARHFRNRYEDRRDARRGVQTGRMFAPSDPLPSQDSDPGP